MKTPEQIKYELNKITRIRKNNVYEDYCASIICKFGKIKANLNIDITTGDIITPKEVKYNYPRILEGGHIPILAYTIETILAEKFETISARNITTTRARDFYDLYMLYTVFGNRIDYVTLKNAIINTSNKRGSYELILEHKNIFLLLTEDKSMIELWDKYIAANPYAIDIKFQDTMKVYKKMLHFLNQSRNTGTMYPLGAV